MGLADDSYALDYKQKINSAWLVLKIREHWSEQLYPKSAEFINSLYNAEIKADDPGIRHYLSDLEEVAIFWNDGLITDNHVMEFFLPDLRMVEDNPHLKARMEAKHKEDPFIYANLIRLLEVSKGWKP